MILSNNLAYVADAAFSSIGNMSVLLAWLGAIAYTYRFILIFPVILDIGHWPGADVRVSHPGEFQLPVY